MRSELGDKIPLQHILDAIDEIHKYLVGADRTNFLGISTPVHKTIHPILRSHQPQHFIPFPAILQH